MGQQTGGQAPKAITISSLTFGAMAFLIWCFRFSAQTQSKKRRRTNFFASHFAATADNIYFMISPIKNSLKCCWTIQIS